MINGMAFCAGGGALELGLYLVMPEHYRCVCAVERQAYPAACLLAWMEKTPLGAPPVWDDLATFDPGPWVGLVDIVSMGLPCQPYSKAGRKLGEHDPRALWPLARRHIRALGPRWIFGENVERFLTSGFEHVKVDLEADGYRVAAGIFTAEEVGAPHLRERLFFLAELADASGGAIRPGPKRSGRQTWANSGGRGAWAELGHADSNGSSGNDAKRRQKKQTAGATGGITGPELCHPHGPRLQGQGPEWAIGDGPDSWPWPAGRGAEQFPWEAPRLVEPGLGGTPDGVGVRAERIYMLGEGVVPVSAALAFVALWRNLNGGEHGGHPCEL